MRETKSITEIIKRKFMVLVVYAEAYRALITFFLEIIIECGEELPGELGVGRMVCVCEEWYPRIRTHEVEISSQPSGGEKLIIGPTCGQHLLADTWSYFTLSWACKLEPSLR